MEALLASLLAITVIGVGGAVISWVASAIKRGIKGTDLSSSEEEDLRKFKAEHSEEIKKHND